MFLVSLISKLYYVLLYDSCFQDTDHFDTDTSTLNDPQMTAIPRAKVPHRSVPGVRKSPNFTLFRSMTNRF